MSIKISVSPLLLLALALLAAFAADATIIDQQADGDNNLRFSQTDRDAARAAVWRMDQQRPMLHQQQQPHQQQRDQQALPKSAWRSPPPPANRFNAGPISMASIVYKSGKFQIVPNSWAPVSVAYGMLARTMNTSGWDILDVVTGNDKSLHNDTASMYAAGLLEGYLTGDRIAQMYTNIMAKFFATEHSRKVLQPRVRAFLGRQFEWARDFAAKSPRSPVARHTGFVLAQLQGLIDGYLARNDTVVRDPFVLHLLNSVGDMLDLQIALNDTKSDHFHRMGSKEFQSFVHTSGHCSALIRVTPGLERLYMGHSSWFLYAATLRIYKHYFLNLRDADLASRFVSFSSYPGFLESLDDFYILDSGMVVLQTTNNVFNVSLYKSVKPQSLLAWQRVRVANMIARNGSHWAWVVSQQNSGTYNNQYMIIDLRRIRTNVSIDDGALTIVEQIPTLVVSSDQTAILRTGYFPSYNVPFHEKIYNMSGYPDVVKKRGTNFSYQMAPRAKIFRREAPLVNDSASMAGVLRFNRFRDDPYSEGDACNSICCRGDLNSGAAASPSGCYDSKFTDFEMAKYLTSYAISGPTTGSPGHRLPPFSWKQFPNASHVGLPMTYNFSWVTMSPHFLRIR